MAAATVVAPDPNLAQAGPREHANQLPLSDCKFYRWSLSAANTNTFDSGIPGIVEYALTGTRTPGLTTTPALPGASIRVSALTSAGVFTFGVASGTQAFDLLIWAK